MFGYGSLMWRPDFPYQERRPARIYGFHRALCVFSHFYRGTPEQPGLVLGLDRGGCCKGIAFRVAAADRQAVTDYLDARELISDVYEPRWLPARADGELFPVYTYVARKESDQYAGRLDISTIVRLLRTGVGSGGTALEYLTNTVMHLDELGIGDSPLHKALAAATAAANTG
ncbi:MAG: gamma-glutamylcyclotransferase [Magnetospiraceae bacterium]